VYVGDEDAAESDPPFRLLSAVSMSANHITRGYLVAVIVAMACVRTASSI
jgi:hypothetical protein